MHGLASLGCGEEAVIAEFGRMTAMVLQQYAMRRGKKRWIDKTPNYYRLLPLVDRMFAEDILFIHLVRHPLDSVASLCEAQPFNVPSPADPDVAAARILYGGDPTGWAQYWLSVNSLISQFLAARPSRNHCVRYEDLVGDPETVLRTLFDFMGEELPDDLVSRALSDDHSPGFEDWKIRRTSGIHTRSVGRSQEWPTPLRERLWSSVQPLAASLGYTLEP